MPRIDDDHPHSEGGRWAPRLDPEQIYRNFEEIRPPLSPEEAIFEAERCMYCEYDVPCMRGCPTKIDIPQFIKQIADGQPEDAARTILDANIFGAVCARVCPVEKLCENLCICNTLHNKPIPIGKLQRYATDRLMKKASCRSRAANAPEKKVAVVGAGPGGVSAAFELSRRGHDVVIFEKEREAGGLDRFGIAEYKIGSPFVQAELDYLLQIGGVELRTGREPIGAKALTQLLRDYDAVVLAIGLGATRALGIPGENAKEVVDALTFIRRIKTTPLPRVPVGDRVIVIGAGNTAVDAATQAKRLGASDVTVVYRGGKNRMKCTDHEYEISLDDGCRWIFNAEPVEIFEENGRVAGARFRNTSGEGDEFFELPCDHFIKAIGQVPHAWLSDVPDLKLSSGGTIVVDPVSFMTSVRGLFAAGDIVIQAKEVVNAVYEGKRAALSIDGWLSYGKSEIF
ncbi:MAG: NAD(P)-dependent oxidoreductase [Deltaproteobacteria bacterium]|nr:NAD(P)-dependent oxidoreductase [Deltaproteobacteria bacterium]